MTGPQFESWLRDYAAKFPSILKWLEGLGEAGDLAMRQLWFETLSDVDFRDAMRISLAMAKGELERVGSFDHEREQTAVVIRRAVWRAGDHRRAVENESDTLVASYARYQPAPNGRPPGLQGRSLLEEYSRLIASGLTREQVAARLFPIGPPDPFARRYKCKTCLDRGRVTVWSYEAMAAWRVGRLAACHHREMVGPCCCERGLVHIYDPTKAARPRGNVWPAGCEYSPDRFCLVYMDNAYHEEAIERFGRWCAEWFADHDKRQAERLARGQTGEF